MSDTPFTIIDGVPRPLLAEALKSASRQLLTDRQKDLIAAARKLLSYLECPDGDTRKFPTLERIEPIMLELEDRIGAYSSANDTAGRTWEQACELEQGDTPESPV